LTKKGTINENEAVGNIEHQLPSRADFVRQSAASLMVVAAAGLTTTTTFVEPTYARGRATLEFAYDKYTPRITAGGTFYKNKLKTLIVNNDFAGIKKALAEPPKKRYGAAF
jgi:hypothetical protein